jgi:hypothetical protein
MIEVARRLGFANLFPWDQRRHVEQIWEEYGRFHPDPRSALPPIAELRARPGVMWPFVDGRETQWRYNTARDPAADRARGDFDFYGHPDHRAWIWLRPYEPAAESPDQAYPFWLGTGAVLEHWGTGSMTQRIPTLHRAIPHAYVEMNREDAKRLAIRNHDMVRLVSRRAHARRGPAHYAPHRKSALRPRSTRCGEPAGPRASDPCRPARRQCAVRVEPVAARVPHEVSGPHPRGWWLLPLFLTRVPTAIAAVVVAVERAPPGVPERSAIAVMAAPAESIAGGAFPHPGGHDGDRAGDPPERGRTRVPSRPVTFRRPAPPRSRTSGSGGVPPAPADCHSAAGTGALRHVPVTPHPDNGPCLRCRGHRWADGSPLVSPDANRRYQCHATGGRPRLDAETPLDWRTTAWPRLAPRTAAAASIPHDLGSGGTARVPRGACHRRDPDGPSGVGRLSPVPCCA